MNVSGSKSINVLFLAGLFIVLFSAFLSYVILKEFPVRIEVPCDPTLEVCHYRNCDIEECPVNNLNYYRQYELLGYVFDSCIETDGCEAVCKNEVGSCTEIACDPEVDICTQTK